MNNIEQQKKPDKFLSISILIAAVLIGGALIYSAGLKNVDRPSDNQIKPNEEQISAKPEIGDDVILGDPEAPVTIFIFGDYQCPACGMFYKEIEPLLRKDYIDTGKAKMVNKDFPLESIHPFARPAAEASECAKDQGKYWLYHDALFERQQQLSQVDFAQLAVDLNLNKEQFSQCYDNRKYKDEVAGDINEGLKVGVDATPTIFINGNKFRGVAPYNVYTEAIEEALKK